MKVIVIGGGAAGMMAALAAAREGAEVTLLEKNEKTGKKLFITGKGRCNLTNACDREEFMQHILRNERFLYSSFGKWSNYDMMDLVEALGTPLKTERGNRVFPQSDKSSDILRALQQGLKNASVTVVLHCEVQKLIFDGGSVSGVTTLTKTEGKTLKKTFYGDSVIVATGGLSYPATGSTGDGYRFAESAGHSLSPRMPALVPVEARFPKPLRDRFSPKDLMGLSLKNVSVLFEQGGAELASDFGEMLFTHFGVSGPIVLSASSLLGEALLSEKGRAKGKVLLHIDLKAALTAEQLEARFIRESEGQGAKQLGNFLGSWLPRTLIPVVLAQAGAAETKKLAGVSGKERNAVIAAIKDLILEATGLRGYEEAIVTRGGVSVKEINPATMESKKIKRLYFAGEVLDLDGETGGFNLQIAWSTGCAAGRAAGTEG